MVALFATAWVQKTFAQDTSTLQPSELLNYYYNIKDALVSGDADKTAVNTEQFVKNLNRISTETVHEPNREAFLKDAGRRPYRS